MSPIAVIAGVGPGTGGAIAKRFAETYKVALLSRSQSSYDPLVKEINSNGGEAIGISTDVTDSESIVAAFKQIDSKYKNNPLAVCVYNASGGFQRAPFLETPTEAFRQSANATYFGAIDFSKQALMRFTKQDSSSLPYYPSLLMTGATASVKSSAMMSTFSGPKWALRALSQSLAKEFSPKGIHVGHFVIDGIIDIPRTAGWGSSEPDAKLSPNAIAETYWNFHKQHRSAWTWEVDLRPWTESW